MDGDYSTLTNDNKTTLLEMDLKIICLNSDLNYNPLYYSPLFNLHFYLNLNLLYLFIFIYKFDYLLFFYKYSTFYSLFSIKEY
jgi:hypothetical protein